MLMELAAAIALARACAPSVAPETLLSIAHAESGLNPYAINVNGGPPVARQPASREEAIALAARLIVVDHRSVDLGLAQINSRNLDRLGLTITDAFDPCRNLAAAARIVAEGYGPARDLLGDGQAAIGQALSRYNTGDPTRGFTNGYVARVEASARVVVPAIEVAGPGGTGSSIGAADTSPSSPGLDASRATEPVPAPAFDVFAANRDRSWDVFHASGPTPTHP